MIRMVYSPIGIIIGERVNSEPGLLALNGAGKPLQ